jgi:hypothetical protein
MSYILHHDRSSDTQSELGSARFDALADRLCPITDVGQLEIQLTPPLCYSFRLKPTVAPIAYKSGKH